MKRLKSRTTDGSAKGTQKSRHPTHIPDGMPAFHGFLYRSNINPIQYQCRQQLERDSSDTASPDTINPDTVSPDTINPDTASPDTINPDTVSPDTINPDTVNPDTVNPDIVNTDIVNPDIISPDTVNSDSIDPNTIDPGRSVQGILRSDLSDNLTGRSNSRLFILNDQRDGLCHLIHILFDQAAGRRGRCAKTDTAGHKG